MAGFQISDFRFQMLVSFFLSQSPVRIGCHSRRTLRLPPPSAAFLPGVPRRRQAPEDWVQEAMEACRAILDSQSAVQVHEAGVLALCSSASASEVLERTKRVAPPLRFGAARDALNFHALSCCVLQHRLSYYQDLVPEDAVLFALVGMHIAGAAPGRAAALREIGAAQVADFLNVPYTRSVPLHSEDATQPEGIYVERPGPLAPFVDDVVRLFRETGAALEAQGFGDLAAAVLKSATDAGGGEGAASRAAENLYNRVPALREGAYDLAVELRAAGGAAPPSGAEAPSARNRAAQALWELKMAAEALKEGDGEGAPSDAFLGCLDAISKEDLATLPAAPSAGTISALLGCGALRVGDELRGALRAAAAGDGAGGAEAEGAEASGLHRVEGLLVLGAMACCERIRDELNARADGGEAVGAMDVAKWLEQTGAAQGAPSRYRGSPASGGL